MLSIKQRWQYCSPSASALDLTAVYKYEQLVLFGSFLTFINEMALQTGQDTAEDLAMEENTAAI